MNLKNFIFAAIAYCSALTLQLQAALANNERGLIIHAAEIGIGKFHRQDNKVHPYEHNNIWKNYVLPEEAGTATPLVRENDDQSVTIFFSNLEELLNSIVKVSDDKAMKVDVLNINAHGMPGAMWFPSDAAEMKSAECRSWVNTAHGDDKANYDQYYSPVSRSEIIQLRWLAKLPSMKFLAPCTTGASQWNRVIQKNSKIKTKFASDAQIHLFSCVVGLGRAGKGFTTGLASALLSGEGSKVEASMNFGLGDWSMPEGMGFWDYLNRDQLNRDNARYPIDRKDRDLMQKGQIRLAMKSKTEWETGVLSDLDFMLGTKDDLNLAARGLFEVPDEKITAEELANLRANGLQIRIVGTSATIPVTVK